MTMLIGLNGVAGAGKDTIADWLVAKHGWRKFSFSDALYQEVSEAFSIPINLLQDRTLKEKKLLRLGLFVCDDHMFVQRGVDHNLCLWGANSPREVLQVWGTEYRRAQDPDYWVRQSQEAFAARDPQCPGWVNTSTRFANEAVWVREEGGTVIEVIRPGTSAINGHVSETPLPNNLVNMRLINGGSVEELQKDVDTVLTLLQPVG